MFGSVGDDKQLIIWDTRQSGMSVTCWWPEHTFMPTFEVLVERPCAHWHGYVLVGMANVLIKTLMCLLGW